MLLSTYNGETFLPAQLDSIHRQKGVEAVAFVRDDGSTDQTASILEEYSNVMTLGYAVGGNLGPARSFWELVLTTPDGDYFALCDQDDVWLPDKLLTAISKLGPPQSATPRLYYSAVTLVDRFLSPVNSGRRTRGVGAFGSGLIFNPAAGCTMVFNRALLEKLRQYPDVQFAMHDAWIYRVAYAISSEIIYDTESHILYRQHTSNAVGANQSFRQKVVRRFSYVLGRSRLRECDARSLLKGYGNEMPEENRELIDAIANYRHDAGKRLLLLSTSQIRLATRGDRALFTLAVLTGSL